MIMSRFRLYIIANGSDSNERCGYCDASLQAGP